jgi:cysteine-S-conjugate beta-lyase
MNFDKAVMRRNTIARKWDAMEEVFGTNDLLPMWVADMDFQSPKKVVEAIVARAEHGVYGYPFRDEVYFESVINWQQRRHSFALCKEWLVCTPAVITAISVAVQTFTQPGDKIIIQPPVYPPFFTCVTKNKRQVVENPLLYKNGRYEMDFADLEQKITPEVKMIILCNPHNPIGRAWEREELCKLGELCVKHNIVILADEMHGDLVLGKKKHVPLATLSPEIAQQTVTFISPAKTFNLAGFYNSITIIPNENLRKQFYQAMDCLELLAGNLFGIVSLEAAYQYGEGWLAKLLPYLEENADYLVHYIQHKIPLLAVSKPEATYLAWIDCRGLNMTTEELKQFFICQAKVAVNDGSAFGRQGDGFVRLNFGCNRARLEEGLKRIKNAVDCLSR